MDDSQPTETTIRILSDTKERLNNFARKAETHDDAIKRLLDLSDAAGNVKEA